MAFNNVGVWSPEWPTMAQVEEYMAMTQGYSWYHVRVVWHRLFMVETYSEKTKTWTMRSDLRPVLEKVLTVGTPEHFTAKLLGTIDGKTGVIVDYSDPQ